MATNTPKLNLVKPGLGDNVDITELNGNMDILDDAFTSLPDATTSTAGVVKGTTSDGDNTALGNAFTSNTTGSRNTAVGFNALASNTTANNNVAVGQAALQNTTEGSDNSAFGRNALRSNTTGLGGVAVGKGALQNSTTGNANTAVGLEALRENTTGGLNVAIGQGAMRNSHTTGSLNVAVGIQALVNSTTSNNNTVIGRNAGDTTTTSSSNVIIGSFARASSPTVSNEVTLGNSSVATLRCNQTSISSLSDVRDKTDIETTTLGLDVINQVRPVEFTWARRDGTMGDTPDLGFIAQELAQVEDDLGETDRLRLTLRENPEKLEASPNRLLPVLVKAVQELSAQNDELRARLDAVEAN